MYLLCGRLCLGCGGRHARGEAGAGPRRSPLRSSAAAANRESLGGGKKRGRGGRPGSKPGAAVKASGGRGQSRARLGGKRGCCRPERGRSAPSASLYVRPREPHGRPSPPSRSSHRPPPPLSPVFLCRTCHPLWLPRQRTSVYVVTSPAFLAFLGHPGSCTAQLSKEYITMQKEPPPFVWAAPDEKNILNCEHEHVPFCYSR